MPKAGDKVKVYSDSKDISNWGGCDDATFLSVGGIYEVEDVEVHSWHTKVKLKDINGWFNSAHFEKSNGGSN